MSNTQTNKEFSRSNDLFNTACREANVKPTKRQASKFKLHKDMAFKYKGKLICQNLT